MSGVNETREELLSQLSTIRQKLAALGDGDSSDQDLVFENWSSQSPRFAHSHPLAALAEQAGANQFPLALVQWNTDLEVTQWSSRAEEMFGWKADEVLGRCWEDFAIVHEDDHELVRLATRDLFDGEKDYNTCSNRNYRCNGDLIYCDWFNALRRNADGEPMGLLSLVHDATQRIQSGQEAQRLRDAMQVVTNSTSRYMGVQFYEALVTELASALHLRYVILATIDGPQPTVARSLAFWANGKLNRIQYELRHTPCERVTEGEVCLFSDDIQTLFPQDDILQDIKARSYIGAPLKDSHGKVIGLLAGINDQPINDTSDIREIFALLADRAGTEFERNRTEDALARSEQRFRLIVEHAPEAVVLFDTTTGQFIMANSAAEKLYKYSIEELCELGPADISPPNQPDGSPSGDRAKEYIDRALAGETPVFEWTHRDAHGNDIPCEVRLLSLEIEGHRVVRGSVTDVTEKKQADASQRQLESELARFAPISVMSEIVGGIAHEMNQPLYAIQNFGKACNNLIRNESKIDTTQMQSWLSEIVSTAQHAGEILLRLRGFASQEPGRREPVDLSELINSAVNFTQHDAGVHGIKINASVPNVAPIVRADSVHIQHVLVHLLRNAFDAVQQVPDSRIVKIAVESDGQTATVAVTDNGVGLPQDQKIFDAFTSTKTTGLGIGLAIAKSIIENHGGTLAGVNREGGGAEFRFSLPITSSANHSNL